MKPIIIVMIILLVMVFIALIKNSALANLISVTRAAGGWAYKRVRALGNVSATLTRNRQAIRAPTIEAASLGVGGDPGGSRPPPAAPGCAPPGRRAGSAGVDDPFG